MENKCSHHLDLEPREHLPRIYFEKLGSLYMCELRDPRVKKKGKFHIKPIKVIKSYH